MDGKVTLETGVSPEEVIANIFLLPYAIAFSLPHEGFAQYPYEKGQGYGQGERPMALSLRTSRQFLAGGRQAQNAELRVRGKNRLGWDFSLSAFERGAFRSPRQAGYYAGHLTANYLQTGRALLELGLGFASFQDPEALWGPSAELALELFPARPWSACLRAQAASIEGQGFHELSAFLGASWRWLGLRAGFRALLNPVRNAYGPEAGLQAWF